MEQLSHAVAWFAERMLETLYHKHDLGRRGWDTADLSKLLGMLRHEVDELEAELINRSSAKLVVYEATDVAAFAMFIAYQAYEMERES